MTDTLADLRDRYGSAGLVGRLKAALVVLGPEERRLTPQDLAGLDQFHTRGLAATAELAEMAGVTASMSVLDVGSGLGGPARYLAAACGCRVVGVDLSEPFIEVARYLTLRSGQDARVSFEVASALDLPFGERKFDAVLLQHVAMNILDRTRLYAEIRRVLTPQGRFATFDIVSAGAGEPHYPLPWARTAATSFLMTAEATRAAVEAAGFRTFAWRDDTEAGKAWLAELRANGPPPALNLGVVMGPDMAQAVQNLGRSLMEGRLGVVSAVFEAAPATA
jgi:ubiquinone/menaquinone biosynthesis C-methylase UbiE